MELLSLQTFKPMLSIFFINYANIVLFTINIGMAQQALLHAGNARDVLLAADAAKQQGRQIYERSDVLPIMELIYLVMGQAQLALKK